MSKAPLFLTVSLEGIGTEAFWDHSPHLYFTACRWGSVSWKNVPEIFSLLYCRTLMSTDVANQPAAIYVSPVDDQVCLKSWSLVWFQEVLPLPELNSEVNAGANSLRVRFWHFARRLHLKLSIILTAESHLQKKDKKDKSVSWHLVTSFYGWWISVTWQVQSYQAMDGWVA